MPCEVAFYVKHPEEFQADQTTPGGALFWQLSSAHVRAAEQIRAAIRKSQQENRGMTTANVRAHSVPLSHAELAKLHIGAMRDLINNPATTPAVRARALEVFEEQVEQRLLDDMRRPVLRAVPTVFPAASVPA